MLLYLSRKLATKLMIFSTLPFEQPCGQKHEREIEPKVIPLTGEELGNISTNTTNEARRDIRARGVLEKG